MGTFPLGLRGGEHRPVQFGSGDGRTRPLGTRPRTLSAGSRHYWIGHLGKREWFGRYLGIDEKQLDRAGRFLAGKGAWSAFFAFLPYVGEAIAILLGLMRSNVWITTLAMFAGKALRYVAVLYAVQGAISLL